MNNRISFGFKLMLSDADSAFFGPGSAELLRKIDKTGNVKEAASEMGLSYTKAWTIIRNAKRGLGTDAVKSSKGGINGGSAMLTEEGRKLLECYERFERESKALLEESFRRCFDV